MNLTLKIAVFAVVAVTEVAVAAVLGVKYAWGENAAAALAIVSSAVLTIVVVGWVLFAFLD